MDWETLFAGHMLDASFTGEILGRGAYGIVEKVIINGRVCAGKSIHIALMTTGGYNDVIKKYYTECKIMSLVDHPNITKFLGVCAMPGRRLPVLVMAKLDGNLNDLLQTYKDPPLPLSLKLSVIDGVAKGLHYLHNFNQDEIKYIIHRDLTARNVLLTSDMVAKITDFGVSRIIDKRVVQKLSTKPGTLDYMPPEAIRSSPSYGPSLDIFSFGHLALVTLTQNTLGNLPDDKTLSEVERRMEFFEELEAAPDNTQCNLQLKELITECLDDDSHKRPSSEQVKDKLEVIKRSNELDIPNPKDITRAANILKVAESDRIEMSRESLSTNPRKISYLFVLVAFFVLLILMARSGILTQVLLRYPLFLFLVSGVILYGGVLLFDFIFLVRIRFYNVKHFSIFMAVWCALMSAIFWSFIPPLKLNAERIIFRPTDNCNFFENPPKYICSIMGKKFYITNTTFCDGTVSNATPFYIISLWMEAKNQYRLKSKVHFHPDNVTSTNGEIKLKNPYWLPKEYCIQEYIDSGPESIHVSNDKQLSVGFYSWNRSMARLGDTGYIDRSYLEEYNTGWYQVSNCIWEISREFSRLFQLEDYCMTGYVSSYYVTLPNNMASILHDSEGKL